MSSDFESEFASIAERLSDIEDPEVAISLLDISQVVERLNEAALNLGRYVSKVISYPRGITVECPDDMLTLLPPLAVLCDALSEVLHDFVCEACNSTCECGEPDCEQCNLDEED